MRTHGWLRTALVAVALLGALAADGTGARGSGTLTMAQSGPVTALDLAGLTSERVGPAEGDAAFLVYDGLVRLTENLALAPELATSWSVSPDGRAWTFTIRPAVAFQDGTPMTAQAIASELQRAQNPAATPSSVPRWDPTASVTASDAAKLQITTKEPNGALLNSLADASALIPSPAAVEKWGADYKAHPIGSGPYIVDRWDPGAQLELTRNPKYWGAAPGLDRIVLRAEPDPTIRSALLRNGQVQVAEGLLPEDAADLRRLPSLRILVRPGLRTFGMAINLNRPALQDVRVRQALNYAVSKELLVKALFGDSASVLRAPLAEQAPGFADVGPWPYDPPKARRLLDDAGWKPAPPIGIRVKDGTSLEVVMLTPVGVFPHDVEVTETLADYLRNVGFEPHFLYAEAATFWDLLLAPSGQLRWDLVLFGLGPSNGDSSLHLDARYRSNPDRQSRPPAWNITWYAKPQVDVWLDGANRALDPRVRAAADARIERQVWADAPYLWLYAEDIFVGTSKDVKGVEVLPTGFTILRSATR